jgi:hypothetical protein
MAMPHPQITMVPFGCVIRQTVYSSSARVDIYRDATAIKNAHLAFKRLMPTSTTTTIADVIFGTEDDGSATNSPDHCSVLDKLGRKVVGSYSAWRILANNSPTEKFKPVPSASTSEPRMVIEPGFYYFLLPFGVIPPDKKTALKNKKS